MRARKLLLALTIAGFAAGCGEDEGGGGGAGGDEKAKADAAAKKAADKKKRDEKKKKKKVKEEVASFIPTLERVVPPEEAPTIRRRLKERDFAIDPTGAENRDPFRSFLLPQVGTDQPTGPSGPVVARPTDQCAKNKLVATNYALRDLKLIGIVVRGAQRYAMFKDAKGEGHMVERGKCMGREKALVTEIGDGHVTIEILPEAVAGAGGVEPTAEKKSIPLYPNELTVDDLDETEDTTDSPTTEPAAVPGPPT
jgi:Tfp pilus assembly protein PilP